MTTEEIQIDTVVAGRSSVHAQALFNVTFPGTTSSEPWLACTALVVFGKSPQIFSQSMLLSGDQALALAKALTMADEWVKAEKK